MISGADTLPETGSQQNVSALEGAKRSQTKAHMDLATSTASSFLERDFAYKAPKGQGL